MQPLVSILVPCYNHEEYIADCLNSILALSYTRIEILISDDCSTDGTMRIVSAFEDQLRQKAERLVICENKHNLGICKNANKIWNMAYGDYYKFIASDDILMPDSLDKLVAYMEDHIFCNILHANAFWIGENTHYPLKVSDQENILRPRDGFHGKKLTTNILIYNGILAPSTFIRKKTKEKYGIYDESLGFEDWEYWLRVSVNGSIEYLDEVVCAYRILESSASHFRKEDRQKRKKFMKERNKIFNRYKEYADERAAISFLSEQLVNAHDIRDKQLMKDVEKMIRDSAVTIPRKYRIIGLLMDLRIFPIYKKMKEIGNRFSHREKKSVK